MDLPLLTDEFIRRESLQYFQPLGKVVRCQEGRQMLTKLLMRIVVVPIGGRLLQRAIHALDLPIRPGMIGFGQAMLYPVFATDTVKQQREGIADALPVDELDVIVGQDGMDFVGHSGNEMAQVICTP